MDRSRFRGRFRRLLAVGGILVALTYLGTLANRARLTWAAYRLEAKLEDGQAQARGMDAFDAGLRAAQARRQGQIAEAEQWTRFMGSSRREESLHREKSREWLGRWW